MRESISWVLVGVTALIVIIVLQFRIGQVQTEFISQQQHVNENELDREARKVFEAVNQSWREVHESVGRRYIEPKLIMVNNRLPTRCGVATPFSPFYCPANRTIYMSSAFQLTLEERGALGNRAFGYVVAHEVAHHVQHTSGLLQQKYKQRRVIGNEASRIIENTADCMGAYSVYYAQANSLLDYSYADLPQMINGASAVGCDHSADCTHGSNEQREEAVVRGYGPDGLQNCASMFDMPN